MTHADKKVVAYYAMSAYSTARKKEMSVDNFFKVRAFVKNNKTMNTFMKNIQR